MTLGKEIFLLQSIKALCDGVVNDVKSFIGDHCLVVLARKYDENLKKKVVEVGLNLFVLISDIYHRENFHSDLLKVLLDPMSPHKEGDKYLRLFIEYLRARAPGLDIDPANYTSASVVREQGKIDLLIHNKGPKRNAIIIENKMNDAPDMYRQIPRYLQYVKELGCECDAIIYLRLNREQYPDMTDWTESEQTEIQSKLICITAYADSPDDLLNGWLYKCEKASDHIDAMLILRQYGALIRKLGSDIMNKPIMKEFYEMMLVGDNFKTAKSLTSMWDDLVLYRVEAIIDNFRNDLAPFRKIDNYNDGDAYFTGLMWKGAHLGIDIIVESDGYVFQFWDRNDREGSKALAKTALLEMNCLQEYTITDGSFNKSFAFPSQQDELIEHIRSFKLKLQALTKNSSNLDDRGTGKNKSR